jgi:hypothetical protein
MFHVAGGVLLALIALPFVIRLLPYLLVGVVFVAATIPVLILMAYLTRVFGGH